MEWVEEAAAIGCPCEQCLVECDAVEVRDIAVSCLTGHTCPFLTSQQVTSQPKPPCSHASRRQLFPGALEYD